MELVGETHKLSASEGEAWSLNEPGNHKRQVTVKSWKGKVQVVIREYYEKDEKWLPGKSGLNLSLNQYDILKDLIQSGSLDAAIASQKK